ncbi:MAG: SAM-dependent methyltransferase [Nocardioidaceae bacterium]
MTASEWLPVREAWFRALYGPAGFYQREQPRDHFRTSVHASGLFAEAMVGLVRQLDLDGITDFGTGSAELLAHVHGINPELLLTGIDLRPRPDGLATAVEWRQVPVDATAPAGSTAGLGSRSLLLLNEVLDNVPCDVVERAPDGALHVVEVNSKTGDTRLGDPASAEAVAWVQRWWPVSRPGQRVEVGLSRDVMWADLCAFMPGGACLAIDYGHLRGNRPAGGTLTSYRCGRQTGLRYDGAHDVTASVAVDSLVAQTGGQLSLQRELLHGLGVHGARPPRELASRDPRGYVLLLARATQAAELTAIPGLGAFHTLLCRP